MAENAITPKLQLSKVIQMTTVDTFGSGLISVFIPVFLLTLGYSLKMVMGWYLIQETVFLGSTYLSVYSSNNIGLVHTLQIKFLFQLANLVLLLFLPHSPVLFFWIPIMIGLNMAFHWIPLNILFLRNTNGESIGGSLSKLSAYPKFFSMFCPIIGAFVISQYSYNALFILAIIIISTSSFPLWPLRSEKTNFIFTKESVRKIWDVNKVFFLPEVLSSVGETSIILLNIFIYIKLLSVTKVGLIGSITLLASVVFTLIFGKLADRWDKHKMIRVASILCAGSWLSCFYIGIKFPIPWLFYIGTFTLSLSIRAFVVSYQSLLFNNARESDAQFLVLREIPNVTGRLILYLFVLVFTNYMHLVFVMAALSFMYFIIFDTRKLSRNYLQSTT
jgi:MFS family permease